MRVKGVTLMPDGSTEHKISLSIRYHTGKSLAQSRTLAKQILNGAPVEFDDDWALEQDLKDLGVKF